MKGTIWLALLLPILATAAQAANPVEFDLLVREIVKKGESHALQSVGAQSGPQPTKCTTIAVDTGSGSHSVWVDFIGDEVDHLMFSNEERHGHVVDELQFYSDPDGSLKQATTSFGTRDGNGMTYLRSNDVHGLSVEGEDTQASFQKELAFWREWLRRR